MASPSATLFNAFPPLSLAAIIAFLALPLIGWISAIIGATRSEKGRKYRPWIIFPLTHPFGLIFLALRDFKAARAAIIWHMLGILALPIGGLVSRNIEKGKLRAYQDRLVSQGVSLELKDLSPSPGPPQDNIWEHPTMKPLADAGQHNEAGQAARERLNQSNGGSPLAPLRIPNPLRNLRYEKSKAQDDPPSLNNRDLFKGIHRTALTLLSERDGSIGESNTPESWEDVATIINEHFETTAELTAQLEQAIQRPNDHYPYEWEQAFQMLLPHLSHLKALTQTAKVRSQAAAMVYDSEGTFRMLHLGLGLSQTGDSDLLISRLVQFAQTAITLEGIRTAQQFHVGKDAQWKELQDQLNQLNFPSLIAASLGAERALGHATVSGLLNAHLFGIVQQIRSLNAFSEPQQEELPTIAALTQGLLNGLFGAHAQALMTRNWHLALQAYEGMIQNVSQAESQLASIPWNQCSVASLPHEIHSYGILAAMLLPALDSAFAKAVEIQHRIELTKVAIALERYRIAHDAYPEQLAELAPQFVASEPIDPMTGSAWDYTRTAPNGFILYSYGRDGTDDGGFQRKKPLQNKTIADDRSWIVEPELPELPAFTLENQATAGKEVISKEMMERYGLIPGDQDSPPTHSSEAEQQP